MKNMGNTLILTCRKLIFIISVILFICPDTLIAATEIPLYVLVTIDTETSSGCHGTACNPVPISDRIFGRRGGKEYGIPLIMDLLEKHGMKGVFFVNSTLDSYYPEVDIREMVQSIVRRGHDVELHIHPEFRCFKYCDEDDLKCRRRCTKGDNRLAGNNVAQQKLLIDEGLVNLERWAGYRPQAFRAGSFSADENTLDALRQAGVALDSSDSGPHHPLSRKYPINQVSMDDGLLEIPIYNFMTFQVTDYQQYRRFDLESNTFLELKSVLQQAIEHKAGTVMTIMHSFSFCRPETDCPNTRAIQNFDHLLGWIANNQSIRVVTIPEWLQYYSGSPEWVSGSGYVPTTGFGLTLWRAWRRWDEGPKNKLLIITSGAIFLLVLGTVLILLRSIFSGRFKMQTHRN